jgi:hypothetical protein
MHSFVTLNNMPAPKLSIKPLFKRKTGTRASNDGVSASPHRTKGAGYVEAVTLTPAGHDGQPAQEPTSDLAADLMKRIGCAIDEWRAANDLEGLPVDVVLQQVASAFDAMISELRQDTR